MSARPNASVRSVIRLPATSGSTPHRRACSSRLLLGRHFGPFDGGFAVHCLGRIPPTERDLASAAMRHGHVRLVPPVLQIGAREAIDERPELAGGAIRADAAAAAVGRL